MRTRTLFIFKQDALHQGVIRPDIMCTFIDFMSDEKLACAGYTVINETELFWREFYPVNANNPEFPDFTGFARWMSVPLPCFLLEGEGEDVISRVRQKGVVRIREKFKTSERCTVCHASDSTAAAIREMALVGFTIPQREE